MTLAVNGKGETYAAVRCKVVIEINEWKLYSREVEK